MSVVTCVGVETQGQVLQGMLFIWNGLVGDIAGVPNAIVCRGRKLHPQLDMSGVSVRAFFDCVIQFLQKLVPEVGVLLFEGAVLEAQVSTERFLGVPFFLLGQSNTEHATSRDRVVISVNVVLELQVILRIWNRALSDLAIEVPWDGSVARLVEIVLGVVNVREVLALYRVRARGCRSTIGQVVREEELPDKFIFLCWIPLTSLKVLDNVRNSLFSLQLGHIRAGWSAAQRRKWVWRSWFLRRAMVLNVELQGWLRLFNSPCCVGFLFVSLGLSNSKLPGGEEDRGKDLVRSGRETQS
ncbi:hypothetical protein T439DRAFT_330338 [Meredithblackwellia eburnea MCA 4105]